MKDVRKVRSRRDFCERRYRPKCLFRKACVDFDYLRRRRFWLCGSDLAGSFEFFLGRVLRAAHDVKCGSVARSEGGKK